MLRVGHVGMNLLVYAPVAFGLAWVGHVEPLAWGLAAMVLLATLPDVDLYVPVLSHRGITHTFAFAVLVGAILAGAGALLAHGESVRSAGLALAAFPDLPPTMAAGGAFGFGVGTLAVVGHLVGDAFTPMGVAPWQPLSDRRHSLGWFDADSSVTNGLWLGAGLALVVVGVVLGTLFRSGVIVVRPSGF